jgi:hypothetical protein
MHWGPVFEFESCADWPSLAPRQAIPERLYSSLALGKNPSVVGLGIVSAACLILKDKVRFGRGGEGLSASYTSSGQGSAQRTASCGPGGNERLWQGHQGVHGVGLLAIAEAALLGRYPELGEAWTGLLHELAGFSRAKPPYTAAQLQAASGNRACNEAMMHLTDCVYRNIADAMQRGEIFQGDNPQLYPLIPTAEVYGSSESVVAAPESDVAQRLTAIIRAGGNALLVGPTGTLKSETAMEAAMAAGCHLIILDGRPELDERETFGDVTPFGLEARFVDGPVTEAFRLAQSKPVTLLINELLRIDRVCRNNLVSMLDSYTPQQLQAMGLAASGPGRHYVLRLRTGEKLVAPASNLAVVATSNIGDGGDGWEELARALLGRFEVIIDMPLLAGEVLIGFYQGILGDETLAKALAELEEFTRAHTFEANGILANPANARVMLALAAEYRRLVPTGFPRVARDSVTPSEALVLAARWTLIPCCVPRNSAGKLIEEAEQRLLLEVVKAGRSLS